jgi:GH15 family glucan-1,4-alpha-glucosidase
MFGLFPVGSDEMNAAVDTLVQTFHTKDGAVGLPRYENDYYRRVSSDVTGNWWFISSLWLAQYYIETNELDKAHAIIAWVCNHASETGILSEQVSPLDEKPISVAPLTWSQAEYVATLLDTITEKK